jgi:tetratricopeptide (TPR) repeat protein
MGSSCCALAQARQLLQEALRAEENSSKALCLLGSVETSLRNYRAARKHFEAGQRADASNVVLTGAWARMEALAGNMERARELFQAADAHSNDNLVLLQACHSCPLDSVLPHSTKTFPYKGSPTDLH